MKVVVRPKHYSQTPCRWVLKGLHSGQHVEYRAHRSMAGDRVWIPVIVKDVLERSMTFWFRGVVYGLNWRQVWTDIRLPEKLLSAPSIVEDR